MRYKKNNRGSYILTGKDGEEFKVTKKEYEEIKKLTKRANQRRTDRTHMYFDVLAETESMRGIDFEAYQTLLESKGFITEKYTTSLSQFQSKKDVKELIKTLKGVTARGYGNERIDDIRYSLIDKANANFGAEADSLVKRFSEMSRAELLKVYLSADDIIQGIFGSPVPDDVEEFVNKSNTTIDRMLSGSLAQKVNKGEFQKGRMAYKKRMEKNIRARNKKYDRYRKMYEDAMSRRANKKRK